MHAIRVVFSRPLCCLFMGQITWTTLTFWGLYKAPIVILEDNLKLSLFESSAFFSLVFSLLESALCLWIQVHPLWIQGSKRLVLWTQNLTLLEDQGLWIQTIVLHCSCAKTVSFKHVCNKLVMKEDALLIENLNLLVRAWYLSLLIEDDIV